MTSKCAQFFVPRRILSGPGSVEAVGSEAKRLGGKRILIVTDSGIERAGLVEQVARFLESESLDYVVYKDIQPNPTVDNVLQGLKELKSTNCQVVLGIGGGSVLDAGKMIAAMATNDGKVQDYDGVDLIPNRMLPYIAVNTTAGTGSEVTRWSVITDSDRQVKMAIGDENIIPDLAIDDPQLTISVPPHLTAGTGMDALTHAIEGYVGRNATPLTDCLALEAISLITKNLRIAYADGEDLDARDKLMYAQMLGGMAFSNAGVGNVHAMAHQLGAVYDMPHGLANAVILPFVMEYNLIARPDKFFRIAMAMGENVSGLSVFEAGKKAVLAVRALNDAINIPSNLKECDVKEKDLSMLVDKTMDDGAMTTNPRLSSRQDIEELWKYAHSGFVGG